MYSNTDCLIKYSTMLITSGVSQSSLLDIQSHKMKVIPKEVDEFIKAAGKCNIQDLRIKFDQSSFVDSYIDFLLRENICFIAPESEKKKFPALSLFWDYPATITNAILDVSVSNFELLKNVIKFSSLLHNTSLQFRFIDSELPGDRITDFIAFILKVKIRYAEFYLADALYEKLNDFIQSQNFPEGNYVFKFFNSEKESVNNQNGYLLIRIKKKIGDLQCGNFTLNQNVEHFTESQHHNTCLNRKLCIDRDGYIKNCPYLSHHYGHISHTDIAEVVKLPEFQQWWHIRKDEIDVCCDCEFRHMCTDCRALIKDLGNVYSQPAKCTYNPYICKWAGEEGYVPVEECGTYSRETGFVPDKGKIMKLNKELWEE